MISAWINTKLVFQLGRFYSRKHIYHRLSYRISEDAQFQESYNFYNQVQKVVGRTLYQIQRIDQNQVGPI